LQAVFGEHCRRVRMMVLDAQQRQATLHGEIGGKTRRVEIRVQVVRHDRRFDAQQFQQLRDAFLEEIANGGIVEVADMLRNEGFIAAGHTDGVLEPGADCQYRGSGDRQLDRAWRVAACATDELQTAGGDPRDAVVATCDDVAVVHQKSVGDPVETQQGFAVADHQRFATGVGTGHHQREVLCIVPASRHPPDVLPLRGRAETAPACMAA
jgi:hypothetical protein